MNTTQYSQPSESWQGSSKKVTCKRCHATVESDKADKIPYRGKDHIICHHCQAEMEKNGIQN